jgi:uncharacterized protein YmfQ (DUF2313 family)
VSHESLLKALLPPVSYDPAGEHVSAELTAEGARLDAALALSVTAVDGVDPFRSLTWLSDYERVYGLPDACARDGQTLQERISTLAVAVLERHGVSRTFYIQLAAVLGYQIEVEEYQPFRAGISRVGDRLTNVDWMYAWAIRASAQTTHRFRAGRSLAGEPLAWWGDELLECVMRRLKPAHTAVLFTYGDEHA